MDKLCTGCGITKPLEEFHLKKSNKDGRHTLCHLCRSKKDKLFYEKNRETIVAQKKDYYSTHKETIAEYWKTPKAKYTSVKNQAKNRSKKRSISFDLTFDEFMTLWGQPCTYCGDDIDTIGVDRIDSSLGYSLDNCVSCCTVCNKMKLAMSVDEWLGHMKKIISFSQQA